MKIEEVSRFKGTSEQILTQLQEQEEFRGADISTKKHEIASMIKSNFKIAEETSVTQIER